jgi:hypothetical protein
MQSLFKRIDDTQQLVNERNAELERILKLETEALRDYLEQTPRGCAGITPPVWAGVIIVSLLLWSGIITGIAVVCFR